MVRPLWVKIKNKKILDKLNITLYNKSGFKTGSSMENILIKSYEACQVRKEAAISSAFMQRYSP